MHLLKNLYLFQSIHITIASIPRNWFSHIIRRTIYEPIIIYFATSIFCPPITYCNQFDQIHYQTYGKIWCPVQIGKIITFNPIILILIYVVPRWWNMSCELYFIPIVLLQLNIQPIWDILSQFQCHHIFWIKQKYYINE